jgi:hypothetical protein
MLQMILADLFKIQPLVRHGVYSPVPAIEMQSVIVQFWWQRMQRFIRCSRARSTVHGLSLHSMTDIDIVNVDINCGCPSEMGGHECISTTFDDNDQTQFLI